MTVDVVRLTPEMMTCGIVVVVVAVAALEPVNRAKRPRRVRHIVPVFLMERDMFGWV